MIATLISAILYTLFCAYCVQRYELNIEDLAIAMSVNYFFMIAFLIIYCNFCSKQTKHIKFIPDRESFEGWGDYLKFSVPATMLICPQIWAAQVLTFFAGSLGVAEQASQIVLSTISDIIFITPRAILEASCTRTGNSIGANETRLAKRFFFMIMRASIFLTLVVNATVLAYRNDLVSIFSDDLIVKVISADVLPLLVVNCLFNGFATFL